MWSKEVAGVFFIGFVMTTYLKLPIMAVAILGASAAALYFFFSGNNKIQVSRMRISKMVSDNSTALKTQDKPETGSLIDGIDEYQRYCCQKSYY